MFDELPETVPHKSTKKLKTFAFAAMVQVVLVTLLIIIQMAAPEKLGEFQLLTTLYMAPPPPPPPPAPASPAPRSAPKAARPAATGQQPVIQQQPEPRPVEEKPQIVAPTSVPNDIARIVESGSSSSSARGIPGGVSGGIAGGINGGSLGGILGGVGVANIPPPPPTGPVRVGGNVKQPKVLHIEQPHYPPAARNARVEGVVILEATVTAEGNVEKVKVVSGPPLLTDAAVEAVSHWKYEPTYLNGQAVPVILTARISFSMKEAQQ